MRCVLKRLCHAYPVLNTNNKNDLEVHWFALSLIVRTVITQKIIRISSYVNYLVKNSFSKSQNKSKQNNPYRVFISST